MKLALEEITGRGLFYVDPRPGQKLAVSGNVCDVDMVVDEPPVHNEIVAKLSALERIAHDTGHAIGLAGTPRPVTIAQLSVWASQLDAHGIVLVPVSSFITSPASASLPAATR
jgi:polysaccharide deacetylase 2 family uncharacterized protein YibQ